jgi:hypothetical protein
MPDGGPSGGIEGIEIVIPSPHEVYRSDHSIDRYRGNRGGTDYPMRLKGKVDGKVNLKPTLFYEAMVKKWL